MKYIEEYKQFWLQNQKASSQSTIVAVYNYNKSLVESPMQLISTLEQH